MLKVGAGAETTSFGSTTLEISADVIWGKKYEKGKRGNVKEKGTKGKGKRGRKKEGERK